MEWISSNWQYLTLMLSLIGGFKWFMERFDKIDAKLNGLDTRMTVVETILKMVGLPVNQRDTKEK